MSGGGVGKTFELLLLPPLLLEGTLGCQAPCWLRTSCLLFRFNHILVCFPRAVTRLTVFLKL